MMTICATTCNAEIYDLSNKLFKSAFLASTITDHSEVDNKYTKINQLVVGAVKVVVIIIEDLMIFLELIIETHFFTALSLIASS